MMVFLAVAAFGAALLTWGTAGERISRIRIRYYAGQISPHERDRLYLRTWWTALLIAAAFGGVGIYLMVVGTS